MTTSILIVFHSSEGHTATIASRIGARLEERGAEVTTASVADAPEPAEFDAVILGDSIHEGHHSDEVIAYGTRHSAALNASICAVFQVSLTSAREDDESVRVAYKMLNEFCSVTGIEPDRTGLFAGALAFSKYRGMERFFMQHVAREAGLDPDVSSDHSYTDWVAVDAFADSILRLAQRVPLRLAVETPIVDFEAPTVTPQTSFRDVVERLRSEPASAVLVQSDDFDPLCTGSRQGVLGIVTERDVVEALYGAADVDLVCAAEIMSADLVTVPSSASITVMAHTMAAANVRHLVVTEPGGRVGVASSEGLLAAVTADGVAETIGSR